MVSSKSKYLEEKIEEILVRDHIELVQLEFQKQGKDWLLRVFIDHPEGVTLDLCEQVSHRVSEFLDTEDPIETSFSLEVSSPGIERPLTKPGHFTKFLGERVQVQLYKSVSGIKSLTGVLKSFEDNMCSIENEKDSITYTVSLEQISKAKLKPIFNFN